MLSILFIKLVWSVWLLTSVYMLLRILSGLCFGTSFKRSFNALPANLAVSLFFPLMLFSTSGRKRIKNVLRKKL